MPVPPEPAARAEAKVKTPDVENDDVAVAPNDAEFAERSDDDALANCWRPDQTLALAKFKSRLTVPDVVIGFVPESESVEFGVETWTDVTVPVVAPIQTPFLEKQPFDILTPFAKVEVAEDPV